MAGMQYQGQADSAWGNAGNMYGNMGNWGGYSAGAGMGGMNAFMQSFMPQFQRAARNAYVPEQYYVDQAAMDVNQAYGSTWDRISRDLSRRGVNPDSGRFAGMKKKWGLAKAAAEAGAKGRARNSAQMMNFQRNAQLAGLASPLASFGLQAMAQGIAAQGNAAQGMQNVGQYNEQMAEEQAMAGNIRDVSGQIRTMADQVNAEFSADPNEQARLAELYRQQQTRGQMVPVGQPFWMDTGEPAPEMMREPHGGGTGRGLRGMVSQQGQERTRQEMAAYFSRLPEEEQGAVARIADGLIRNGMSADQAWATVLQRLMPPGAAPGMRKASDNRGR